jgi:hypothetical protein
LPVFYMYSLKKGVAVKPWFMSEADVHAMFSTTDAPGVQPSGQLSAD